MAEPHKLVTRLCSRPAHCLTNADDCLSVTSMHGYKCPCPHPAGTYHPGPSILSLQYQGRQLIKLLHDNGLTPHDKWAPHTKVIRQVEGAEFQESWPSGLSLVDLLLESQHEESIPAKQDVVSRARELLDQHGIDMKKELRNIAARPKGLSDLSVETLREIASNVVYCGSIKVSNSECWKEALHCLLAFKDLYQAGKDVIFFANAGQHTFHALQDGLRRWTWGQIIPSIHDCFLSGMRYAKIGLNLRKLELTLGFGKFGPEGCWHDGSLDVNKHDFEAWSSFDGLRTLPKVCPNLKSLRVVLNIEHGKGLQLKYRSTEEEDKRADHRGVAEVFYNLCWFTDIMRGLKIDSKLAVLADCGAWVSASSSGRRWDVRDTDTLYSEVDGWCKHCAEEERCVVCIAKRWAYCEHYSHIVQFDSPTTIYLRSQHPGDGDSKGCWYDYDAGNEDGQGPEFKEGTTMLRRKRVAKEERTSGELGVIDDDWQGESLSTYTVGYVYEELS